MKLMLPTIWKYQYLNPDLVKFIRICALDLAKAIENLVFNDTLKVMTWNIRFGAARIPWFGDSCGDRVIMSENEDKEILDNEEAQISENSHDIIETILFRKYG